MNKQETEILMDAYRGSFFGEDEKAVEFEMKKQAGYMMICGYVIPYRKVDIITAPEARTDKESFIETNMKYFDLVWKNEVEYGKKSYCKPFGKAIAYIHLFPSEDALPLTDADYDTIAMIKALRKKEFVGRLLKYWKRYGASK